MSPRTIPGVRYCEICGAQLKPYQLRFCCLDHSLEWNHHDRATRAKQGRTVAAMMENGEIPKPPRAEGPFRYSAAMREAIHLVKTGSRIGDLTPEQQTLFREYNRERGREVRGKRRKEKATAD